MDQKFERFVTLLHQPSPPRSVPAPPVRRARVTLARPRRVKLARPHRLLGIRLPMLPRWRAPALGPVRAWARMSAGAIALGVLMGGVWLALQQPTNPPPVLAARLEPSRTAEPVIVIPPWPADEDVEENGELRASDIPPAAVVPPPPPSTRVAMAPPSPSAFAPRRNGEPPWLRYAVAPPASLGRPRVAIVIDDLGIDKRRTERAIALKGPLTLSFMSYASDLPRLTEDAHRAGHELMVHVPMEPINRAEEMGPNGLEVSLSQDEVLRRLRWDLARFEGYVGINNHMGSLFTSDASSMTPVIQELKARGLLFLDSRTVSNSVGAETARKWGVPTASRDVFLDDHVNGPAIAERLAAVEAIAKRHGTAIAIGHPHDATLDQLREWLSSLAEKGLVLVPVSAIVRERMHVTGAISASG
ncbi:MAG TPA: divergent polysaccharide deacetylase family protein [Stellaceae bacterium]|nr:divergent polysaccharide deacetylase family protein [Stellaceae bacterium]